MILLSSTDLEIDPILAAVFAHLELFTAFLLKLEIFSAAINQMMTFTNFGMCYFG